MLQEEKYLVTTNLTNSTTNYSSKERKEKVNLLFFEDASKQDILRGLLHAYLLRQLTTNLTNYKTNNTTSYSTNLTSNITNSNNINSANLTNSTITSTYEDMKLLAHELIPQLLAGAWLIEEMHLETVRKRIKIAS